MHIGVGLVSDLGLNRPPGYPKSHSHSLLSDAAKLLKSRYFNDLTLQDMRAGLGCFYITSLYVPPPQLSGGEALTLPRVSTLFRVMPDPPFTVFLSRSCEALLRAEELTSDLSLVTMVRLQRLLARSQTVNSTSDADPDSSRVSYPAFQMVTSTVRKEMDTLLGRQPPAVTSDGTAQVPRPIVVMLLTKPVVVVLAAYRSAVARLYEPAIFITAGASSQSSGEGPRRTECLWQCLVALNDYFAAFLAIPVDQLGTLPLTTIAQTSFAVVTASRLLLLEDPEWDLAIARKNLDLAAVGLSIEERFQAATTYETADEMAVYGGHAGPRGRKTLYGDDGRSLCAMYRDKMHWVRHWYVSKLPEDSRAPTGPAAGEPAATAMEIDEGSAGSVGDIDAAYWEAVLDLSGASWGWTDPVS